MNCTFQKVKETQNYYVDLKCLKLKKGKHFMSLKSSKNIEEGFF